FSVSLERRKTGITLATPDLVKPGDQVKIHYRTDRPSRMAIFAVDEGILQVAAYRTPDPLGFFFQKRALEVSTSQIVDLILPEFARLMAASVPGRRWGTPTSPSPAVSAASRDTSPRASVSGLPCHTAPRSRWATCGRVAGPPRHRWIVTSSPSSAPCAPACRSSRWDWRAAPWRISRNTPTAAPNSS